MEVESEEKKENNENSAYTDVENKEHNKKHSKHKQKAKRYKEKNNKNEGTKTDETEKPEEIEDKNESKEKEDVKTEEPKKEENKKEEKAKKKICKKTKIIITSLIVVILIIAISIFAYLAFRPKFKDIILELGVQEINLDAFLVDKMYKNDATAVTDLSQIDVSKPIETDVTLSYKGKEQTVKLVIKDTTAPQVKFQDITKSLDYKINPDDFIAEKSDLSEMKVELLEAPEVIEYGDFTVKISVKDIYENETIGNCNLKIAWLIPEIVLEVGDKFSIENLVLDVEKFGDRVPKSEIDKVDTSVVGEYIIKVEYEGVEYTSTIKVQDTIPPELELKDISIYDDEEISDYKKFIKKASDASGEPTVTLKTEIDYSKIGKQDVVIEAVDINGNKTEKIATLTIKRDNVGPVFSGLSDKTVVKNSTIDYKADVKATDDRDGKCEFSVDSSGVNLGESGTYYATYTAKDKRGNVTTKKRKIVVKHNQEDTNNKFNEFYNNYLAGNDIVGMASSIRSQIRYNSNWGGDDPVWYGLTEGKGNCYVHALIMQKALTKAGYTNKLIYLTDTSHYWNLVYTGGVWRHIDATPSANHTLGLLTDEQKLADAGLHGKTWERDSWPKAE